MTLFEKIDTLKKEAIIKSESFNEIIQDTCLAALSTILVTGIALEKLKLVTDYIYYTFIR